MNQELAALARDAVARSIGAVALLGIALVHVLDLPGKFADVPYLGVLYLGAVAGSCALAGVLVLAGGRRAWLASAGLAGSIALGYVLSRTTGLPQSHDDVGNWGEQLGVASLFLEGGLVVLAVAMLAAGRRLRAGLPAPVPASA